MPESALAGLSAVQRERLVAMGYELLVLRGNESLADRARDAHHSLDQPSEIPRKRLVLRGLEASVFNSAYAQRLRAVIAALGLREDELAYVPQPELPVLALAHELGAETAMNALAALREPDAKRRLWPTLRRLHRELREDQTPR